MMAALSPSSSPRLPSPPPIAEDQIGPKSPTGAQAEQQAKLFSIVDHGASRRIRPGTKAEDMTEGPPLVDLTEIDSAFQLTEHLKALHNVLTHPIGTNTTIPIDKTMATRLAHPPEGVDKSLWLYELCRFLTQKANSIIIALFSDSPPCSSHTCPEMRASEWQYLCAVHDPPKSCCAIDYCCHTLDWAANTLTSPKHFPSRLALGTEASTAHQQVRQLTNIFRRVYRIFAHAWFQHREVFWKVESRTGLYIFFKTVCDVYSLIPEDNFTIPPDAEGVESTSTAAPSTVASIYVRDDENRVVDEEKLEPPASEKETQPGNTTKRMHRHTPSVGVTVVSTVVEENEDEEENPTAQRQAAAEPKSEPDNRPVPEELEPGEEQIEPPTPMTAIEASGDQDQDPAEPENKVQLAPTPEPEPEVVENPAAEAEQQPLSETADPLPKAEEHDESGVADAEQAPVAPVAAEAEDEKGEKAEVVATTVEHVETKDEAAEVKTDDV
ncbi:Mob1/phocein [Mytilinidion resinicola]|uniref:Mob1/phocein n=1 Tax=Mytilinidion resinicola TaxID=574789 RepID=A0A6A6YA07_9PEZI|nr:Mob1/phocein [Mytilinidion resinicola]KAF2805651.1 Mob1/phocein [Mytilinidion resinicola]